MSDIPGNYPIEEVSSSKPLALCVLFQQFNLLRKAEVLCTCGDALSQERMIGGQHH